MIIENIINYNSTGYCLLKITVYNLLDIVTSAPEDGYFARNTKGLLGNNDGDASNDFQLKNGTTLAINSSEEQLFEFGSSCKLIMI